MARPTRRPTLKCPANRVRCPDPTCAHVQRPHFENGRFRGRGVAECQKCGTPFFHHTADGGTEVVGLWPDEPDRLDIDQPLPEIWRRLGLLVAVQ